MFLNTMLQIQNPNVVIIHKIKMKYVNIVKTSWAALESNSLLSWSFLSVDFGEDVLLVLDVTGGRQSQLLVRLTWTGMDLDWSLTTMRVVRFIIYIRFVTTIAWHLRKEDIQLFR